MVLKILAKIPEEEGEGEGNGDGDEPGASQLAVFGVIPVHLGRPPVWATWAGPIWAGPREISQALGRSGIVKVAGLGRYSLRDHPGDPVLDFDIPGISGMIRSGPSWFDRPSAS
jgi:hypothetical protein